MILPEPVAPQNDSAEQSASPPTVVDANAVAGESPDELIAAARWLVSQAHARVLCDAVQPSKNAGFAAPVTSANRAALEDVVVAAEALVSSTQATQAVALARYAAIDDELLDTDTGEMGLVEHPLGHHSEFADTDLSAAVGWSPRAAGRRVDAAVTACTRTPRLLAQAAAGHVQYWRVTAIGRELADTTMPVALAIDAHLSGRNIPAWSLNKLSNLTRELVETREPDAVRKVRKRTLRDAISVGLRPSLIPGATELHAVLPTEQAAAIYAAIDELAHHYATDSAHTGTDDRKTLGQHRADALHDLVLANASVDCRFVVHIPVHDQHRQHGPTTQRHGNDSTAGGATEDTSDGLSPPRGSPAQKPTEGRSATIPGVGTISPEIVAELLRRFGPSITRALTNEQTGVTAETSGRVYQPSAAVRRFVIDRDGTCRFPQCATPADRCDLDHVTPWPTGATTPSNLQALCRHHHRAKTAGRWRVTMTPAGVCTWTSPTGRTYQTHPATPAAKAS